MLNMKEIKYKQLLDLEWSLRSAELRAKTEWDKMLIYKDTDSLLYDLAYDKVKDLREAQKTLKQVVKVLRDNDLYANGE
tara:strand:- start:59 stop:295 length:237 start_codon:yes stop_codon:yes gene_type:complete